MLKRIIKSISSQSSRSLLHCKKNNKFCGKDSHFFSNSQDRKIFSYHLPLTFNIGTIQDERTISEG